MEHYVRYECDEKLECLWVFIIITTETCQFITTFGAKNYLQEVHPPTRTANLSSQHEKKVNVFPRVELTSAKASHQRAYKVNSLETTGHEEQGGLT